MTAYGNWVRAARLGLGLSREQLRRRILLTFRTAPTVIAIKFLETGRRGIPQETNRTKYEQALRESPIKPPRSNPK